MCICRSAATWRALWASARSCQEDLAAPWNTNIIRLYHRICCLYMISQKKEFWPRQCEGLESVCWTPCLPSPGNHHPKKQFHTLEMQISRSPFWENFCILLGRDGPGRVDVVPGDHADRDACALALLDRGWHLGPHWILARTTSTQNHSLSQLKTFDPKIVHFLSPQCQQCRRRSC